MPKIEGVQFCDGCGAEITWSPVIVRPAQHTPSTRPGIYCCTDCAEGRSCACAERMEFDDDFRERGKISIPF